MKRIMRDYRELQNCPIPGVQFRVNESDNTLWDIVVQWELSKAIIAPLHFLIKFPDEYPSKPPSVGFSCSNIGYQTGASMTEQNRQSALYGKLIICLDILGNFAEIHTEWASSKGSGWSPAYTATSLLNNILVVLAECAASMTESGKRRCQLECTNFMKSFNCDDMEPELDTKTAAIVSVDSEPASPICLEVPCLDDLVSDFVQSLSHMHQSEFRAMLTSTALSTLENHTKPWVGGDELIVYLTVTIGSIERKCAEHGVPSPTQLQHLVGSIFDRLSALLIWGRAPFAPMKICREHFERMGWNGAAARPENMEIFVFPNVLAGLQGLHRELTAMHGVPEPVPNTRVPDPDIMCWFSLSHYTEEILGVGIRLTKKGVHINLSTDGSMLSHHAFQEGLRQTPMKETFQCFLPLWICPAHSIDNPVHNWLGVLIESVSAIGKELGMNVSREITPEENGPLAEVICRVYADLINLTVVQMMQPSSDIRASERIFRLLIDLWRSFRYLYTSLPAVRTHVNQSVNHFERNPRSRHKADVPNVGWLLAMFLVASRNDVNAGPFLHAYVDESFLRCVLWWQKGRCAETAAAVFDATKVSRHLLLFQIMFMKIALGDGDLDRVALLADQTECKLHDECVEQLLNTWKAELQAETTRHSSEKWLAYFAAVSCPSMAVADMDGWVANLTARATALPGYTADGSGQGRGGHGRGGHGRGGRGRGGGGRGKRG